MPTIERAAFLLSFDGQPEKLLPTIDEVAGKGLYAYVFLSALDPLDTLRPLCARAAQYGLKVGIFTGYMKYDSKYLAEHPDQQMVFAETEHDQDSLGVSGWGCPFHPVFKARYFDRLRTFATLPGVRHIDLNDEAFLGSGCYCAGCRAAYTREFDGPMPRKPQPVASDWEDPRWRAYLRWRLERWNAVHREMAAVIRAVNPTIRVSFQASPASDLWFNPWYSGVDLAAMARDLDTLSSDPYYTFHQRHFDPPEAYLGEWCRFLAGLMPDGKRATAVPQGFSHPTFSRPLGRDDGLWSALVPPACGIRTVAPFAYTLQRCSPVLEAYESALKLDPLFARLEPTPYAALIHGLRTELLRLPLPRDVPHSYDGTRLLPVAAALRHAGLPYGFLPDARLSEPETLRRFRVLLLPDLLCLDEAERAGISRHLREGGHAVILGELGTADASGADRPSLLAELFDLVVTDRATQPRLLRATAANRAAERAPRPDPIAVARYMEGAMEPLQALAFGCRARLPSDALVLAEFIAASDAHGKAGGPATAGPAVLERRSAEVGRALHARLRNEDPAHPEDEPAMALLTRYGGRVIWCGGFPTRTTLHPVYGTTVQNPVHYWMVALAEWAAGEPPVLRVEQWPPPVPIRALRPLDQRFLPTFEFFPLANETEALGVVTSYFKEPTAFPMVWRLPPGRRLRGVRELLSDTPVEATEAHGEARIEARLDFDSAARVYHFETT